MSSKEVEMEAADVEEEEEAEEEASGTIPFQLQFDKPIPSQMKIAEWNPEKDLLAMVTEDSKILLHRFNWQRLWTVSPGKCITSLCWRPDGKAIAVGYEDGSIALHDVENGKLLRSIKSHNVAVICLNWEEDAQILEDDGSVPLTYEDRTMRFFPPPPRIPRMPGLSSGDPGLMDDAEDSFQELSFSSHRQFNILCSGDQDGSICFSVFGMFPIGKINIHRLSICSPFLNKQAPYHLENASVHKVALSKNLCQLIVISYGELVEGMAESKCTADELGEKAELKERYLLEDDPLVGFHCLLLDTSIFRNRKHELYQVAQQASSIEDLIEVVRASLAVMHKQWSDAMHTFHEKFDSLSSLINDHGLDSNPQEEFLSFLFGARTSPPLHQFLVNTLGEVGLKRLNKAVGSAGKELHLIVREHLQPAAEIIGFRIGELRGLSRWRARYQVIGLDEKLIENSTEKAGMFLVQVERFLRVLATVIYQFQNFFNCLTKCIKLLLSEPTDQISQPNSEHVITFLKFHFNHDLVRQLLELSEESDNFEVDFDTVQRVEELVSFGGFSDVDFLGRTLAKEFDELEHSFKEALSMPFTTISKKISCEYLLPLLPSSSSSQIPTSIYYDKGGMVDASLGPTSHQSLVDYICFRIPDDSLGLPNSVCIAKGFTSYLNRHGSRDISPESMILSIPDGYECVDLSLYKENHIVLLLNEATSASDSPGKSWMVMVPTSDLPFTAVSKSAGPNTWKLHELKASAVDLQLENGKARFIPHLVTSPLAVSASRGVACAFALRRRALVYILDEDEDEASDME